MGMTVTRYGAVDRKYKDNLLKKEKGRKDHGLRKKLENAWMNTRWIYDDNEFGRLCEMTGEVELRTAERIFVKSLHRIQEITGEEYEFPALSSVNDMLAWVKKWKDELYRTCLQTEKANDIYSFARIILYIEEHVERKPEVGRCCGGELE